MDRIKEIGADRLAYAVAKLVQSRTIDARSEAADALLDYLDVGSPGGPQSVPEWMERHKALQNSDLCNPLTNSADE